MDREEAEGPGTRWSMPGAQAEAEPEPEPEPEAHASALPSAAEFCGESTGLSLAGILRCIDDFDITDDTVTTSDLCHAHIKPKTVPSGWVDEPELIQFDDQGNDISERRWYKHIYRKTGSKDTQTTPPPGTRSMCATLAADPETAHMVGKPTHFLSHAWLYKILNVTEGLKEYVASQREGSAPIFFWFDCFAIDEHATQALPQEWWSTTFKEAIKMMGHTVMLLSPWDNPIPLTRAWCLWELHCTVETGSKFSVCLGPAELQAFKAGLLDDDSDADDPEEPRAFKESVIASLSNIDVRNAQAGDKRDLGMIMRSVDAAPGGPERLNERAVSLLREKFIAESAHGWVDSLRSAAGELETEKAVEVGWSVGHLLGIELDRWEEAKEVLSQVAVGCERLFGANHENTLNAREQLALAMMSLDQVSEARAVYEEVLPRLIAMFGPHDESVLTAQGNLATLLKEKLDDYQTALPLEDVVVAGFAALYGNEAEETLMWRCNRANTVKKLG
jgi:hypothetical protein